MARPAAYVPDRGDLIWVDFDPQAGHEQSGRRPAIVLSARDYNARTGLAVVCPITGQAKGYPGEVPVPAGAPVTGVVLCDQVKNIDWVARQATFIAPAPAGMRTAVVSGVLRSIN